MLISLDRLAPGEKPYAYDTNLLGNTMHGRKKGPLPRSRRLSGLELVSNAQQSTSIRRFTESIPESPIDRLSSPRSPSPLKIVDGRAHNVHSFATARAAHTVLRQGKRYLKPKDGLARSAPPVEMRHHKVVNNFIARKRRHTLRRIRLYMLYCTISDKLDGLPANQSQCLTRERLNGKLAVALKPFMRGTLHLSQQDIETAKKRFAWRQNTWFPYTFAFLFRKWLGKRYIYELDGSPTAYWFEGASYKRQCCEAKT